MFHLVLITTNLPLQTSMSACPHWETSALKRVSTNHSPIPVNAHQDNRWQRMDLAVEVGLLLHPLSAPPLTCDRRSDH